MPANPESFTKHERLCSQKTIEELFIKGKSFYCQPLLVIWMPGKEELPSPAQVAISVPKKHFRHAVQRVRLRRRIRESYRRQKHLLYSSLDISGKKIVFIIIYKSTAEAGYKEIYNSTALIISRLAREIKTLPHQAGKAI